MTYLALVLAVFLGGVVSGFSGFGFSAIAGAILIYYFEPVQAVSLMMICTIAPQVTTLLLLREHIRWNETVPLIVGGIMGVPAGVYLLTAVDAPTFRNGFGVFLTFFSLYMLLRTAPRQVSRVKLPPIQSFFVGSAAGLVGGMTGMPGALPVIWCDLRGITKERLRGVVQPFILVMQILAVAILMAQSIVAKDELFARLVIAIPALGAGTFIGFIMFGRVNERKFRVIVWTLLMFSGCAMMA